MSLSATIFDDLQVNGNLTILGGSLFGPIIARSSLKQEDLIKFPIPWLSWRDDDDVRTLLPDENLAASDFLTLITAQPGWIAGTAPTVAPSIKSFDCANGATLVQNAYAEIVVPENYVDGQTFGFRFHAGVDGVVAGADASLIVNCFKFSEDQTYEATQLVIVDILSINSLVMADKDYFIAPAALISGDRLGLFIQIDIDNTDGTGATQGIIGATEVICDVKG